MPDDGSCSSSAPSDAADGGDHRRSPSLLGVQLLRPVALRRQTAADRRHRGAVSAPPSASRSRCSSSTARASTARPWAACTRCAACSCSAGEGRRRDALVRARRRAQAANIGKPIGEMLVDQNLASPEEVDAALEKQQALRTRRFGEYLTENQIVSPEQLAAALKQQRAQPVQKLGETLVELGYLTEAELEEALAIEARDRSIPLGQILADMGVVDADVVNAVIARKLGIPFVNLKNFRIPPEAAEAHSRRRWRSASRRCRCAESDNALVVAIENPMDMAKLEELRFVAGMKLLPVMASGEDIRAALENGLRRGATPGRRAEVRKRMRRRHRRADAPPGGRDRGHRSRRAAVGRAGQHAGAAGEQDDRRRARAGRLRHPHRGQPGRQGRCACASARTARWSPTSSCRPIPQGAGLAPQDHGQLDITERRKPQDGKIDFQPLRPARRRPARRHHPDRRRARGRGDARARRGRAGGARRARPSPAACSRR